VSLTSFILLEAREDQSVTVKVSVVVPVYNPGRHISYCVDSVLRQSLPPGEFEVIFVDDGSTDGTDKVLDDLAAAHTHIQVIHIPNSGWPGRPRNIGTDAATGRYVHYLDNDDALGTEALERLYAFAEANASDIVIGRYAGHHRAVAREIFRETRPLMTGYSLLADTLTPHKMFRKDFLDRYGLRFPEGRRRLEDHMFVTSAYLFAERISVLSDYVCYYHIRRDDETNAAFQRFVPAGYFGNLEEVMDVVDAHAAPGADRDAFMRRWLRIEMLGRLKSRSFRSYDVDLQHETFDVVHKIDHERITTHVRDSLDPPDRLRARLLHRGDVNALMDYGEHIAGIRGSATLTAAEWHDGVLEIGFDVQLVTAAGDPMPFVEYDGRLHLDVPVELDDENVVPWRDREVGDLADRSRVDLVVRRRADSAEFFKAASVMTSPREVGPGRVAVTHTGRARFDPATSAGGAPLWPGIWDLYLRLWTCGFDKEIRLGSTRDPAVAGSLIRVQLSDSDGTLVRPYWTTPHDNLSVAVDPIGTVPPANVALGPDDVELGPGGSPAVRLPFDVRTTSLDALALRLTNTVTGRVITAKLASRTGSWVEAVAERRPNTGLWQISVAIAGRRVRTDRVLVVPLLGHNGILPQNQSLTASARAAVVYSRLRHSLGRRLKRERGSSKRPQVTATSPSPSPSPAPASD
jgi:poly(ribitol-phosphate) beta-N-acetylglucosaminyltransferase